MNPSWFVGVVEDINDPLHMGRVRVRAFGYHTENKQKIPTASLPWASISMPVTSASLGGIGQSATGIVQGTWVVGMFLDGEEAQKPLIIGTLPSRSPTIPENLDNQGFYDPNGIHPLSQNELDTPLEATPRFAESSEFLLREQKRGLGVNIGAIGGAWSAPLPSANQNTTYPNSQVRKTQSFVEELDNTPGSERYLKQHRTGTHEEVLPDGSKVTYVEGTDYLVVKGDVKCFVDGKFIVHASDNIEFSSDKEIILDGKAIRLN